MEGQESVGGFYFKTLEILVAREDLNQQIHPHLNQKEGLSCLSLLNFFTYSVST